MDLRSLCLPEIVGSVKSRDPSAIRSRDSRRSTAVMMSSVEGASVITSSLLDFFFNGDSASSTSTGRLPEKRLFLATDVRETQRLRDGSLI